MPNKNIWFPKGGHKYFDKALRQTFYSKTEKRNFMNKHGIHEDGSMESERHRTKRLAEEINEGRRKQGLKSKTEQELIGDSRERW